MWRDRQLTLRSSQGPSDGQMSLLRQTGNEPLEEVGARSGTRSCLCVVRPKGGRALDRYLRRRSRVPGRLRSDEICVITSWPRRGSSRRCRHGVAAHVPRSLGARRRLVGPSARRSTQTSGRQPAPSRLATSNGQSGPCPGQNPTVSPCARCWSIASGNPTRSVLLPWQTYTWSNSSR